MAGATIDISRLDRVGLLFASAQFVSIADADAGTVCECGQGFLLLRHDAPLPYEREKVNAVSEKSTCAISETQASNVTGMFPAGGTMTTAARNQVYVDDLRAVIHRKARLFHSPDGFRLSVPCDDCQHHVEAFHMRSKLPVEQIRKKMLNAGWMLLKNKSATCPRAHHATVPAMVQEPRIVPPFHIEIEEKDMAETDTITSSDRAKAAKRDALAWIDEAFNTERGQYKAGVTDETIAKETALSVEAVKKLREEFYGPLKVPTELEALRAECAALPAHIDAALKAMMQDTTQQVSRLLESCEAMAAKIERVIAKGGFTQ